MKYLASDHVKLNNQQDAVIFLDQSRLPNDIVYCETSELQRMYDAIQKLEVRGAPCIGIFAGYCAAVRGCALARETDITLSRLVEILNDEMEYLNSSRPTAVNLSWAIKRMLNRAVELTKNINSKDDFVKNLISEAIAIHMEDIEMCKKIAEYGLSLVKDGDGILTHCNAGPLATSRYGTALGPILLGKEKGYEFHVYSDETRPLLQGARLTSYELQKAGVDVTLICDNMASLVMKEGRIQACFVGCDRVAANGDTANKIGTSGVAILAKHYGIPFYVLGPVSTIDITCETGDDIVIEQRAPEEIKEKFYVSPMALKEVKCYNPSFDVTDNELISAIITDKGILRPPYTESIKSIMKKIGE